MNISKFCVELHNTTSNDYRTHFFVPTIELELEYNRGNELFGTCDTTTFYDKSTGDDIITVPSNLKDVSTWDKWEKSLRKYKISQHSPVYRIFKAIFDGKLIARKDFGEEYGERYTCDWLKGYEIV